MREGTTREKRTGEVVARKRAVREKKILAMEKNYAASGQAVGVTGEVFLDKPIVEQYRRLLRNAGELDD